MASTALYGSINATAGIFAVDSITMISEVAHLGRLVLPVLLTAAIHLTY
jgi:hypothetical protein